MRVTCGDDGETTVDVKFMVDDVKVNFPKGHTNIIQLSDDLTIEMQYPDLDYFAKMVRGIDERSSVRLFRDAYNENKLLYQQIQYYEI